MKPTGTTVFRTTAAVLAALPGPVRALAAGVSALLLFCFSPGRRRNLRANLSLVGVPDSSRTVLGIFRNHSMNIIEMFASSRWSDGEIMDRIEFPRRDLLDEALAAGNGAVLATAHIGNWELPALLLSSLGYRLSVVAGEQMNSFLSDPVRRAKEERGIEVIGPRNPYRRLYRALKAGGLVALLLDGDIFEGGIEAEFFGRKINLPRGAARLAISTGAPVLGAYCRRNGDGSSRISMETILRPGEAAGIGEAASQERIFRALEGYIRDNADQWCIFRRFQEGAA